MNRFDPIFAHAQRLIRSLPRDTSWMFSITDQDGDGVDPTLPSLSVTTTEKKAEVVCDVLGGGFGQTEIDGLLVKVDRGLEISVEVAQ